MDDGNRIDVYRVGSEVLVGPVMAIVLAVQIYANGVIYKVAWWQGRDRKEAWVESCEVSAPDREQRIGFLG